MHICQKYVFIFITMKLLSPKKLIRQIHNAQNIRSYAMANHILKHLIFMWCCVIFICTRQHLTFLWLQCAPPHCTNMCHQTGNMYFIVWKNVHILIFQVMNQISNPKIYISLLLYQINLLQIMLNTDINNDENSKYFVTPRRTIPVPLKPMMGIIQQSLFILNIIHADYKRILQIKHHHQNYLHTGMFVHFTNLW